MLDFEFPTVLTVNSDVMPSTPVKIHRLLLPARCLLNITQYMGGCKSRDSSVGIVTGYWLDDRRVGVRVSVGSRIFTLPCHPDRLWGSPNLLSKGYRGLFPRGKAAGA
jgi:hypothetical protein